jgi:hypothetical protein
MEVAKRFGYTYATLRRLVSDFRAQCRAGQVPPFSLPPQYGRPAGPHRGHAPTGPDQALRADVRRVSLPPGRRLRTRVAGIFLFLPLLAQLRFDQLVTQAGYPGSRMVPATSALLSLLALKLLDKERRSHISDFSTRSLCWAQYPP